MRVFYQVWDRPIVTVNGAHLISRVINLCGGTNVFAQLPLIAPEIDREAVLVADPEVIIASGARGARPAWLDAWNDFPQLRAVADRQLYAMPAGPAAAPYAPRSRGRRTAVPHPRCGTRAAPLTRTG